ncbi:MAG TPA: trehalase family glycosidase [Candidatus Saccharimonadales bacterium]|nr:trehalase family glycosidase [Candidatus Saccharimonadales bacterium]
MTKAEEKKELNTEKAQQEPIGESGDHETVAEVSLEDEAKAVLAHNDHGSFTVPSTRLYPHQWLWDSCFIAIGIRHYDVERAKIEILSMLRAQWANGMMPHMIITPREHIPADAYKRHSSIWRSWLNPNAPDDISTSGITQPPMLAEAVVRIGEKLKLTERHTWYKMVFPALLAYHQWLYTERDPHHEGLVLQIHPWETGLDNTPPWMHELHEHLLPWWVRFMERTRLEKLMTPLRRDTRIVPVDQRFSNVEALALFDAQRRLRRKAYATEKILDHALFAIEDLTFNSIFIRANSHLQSIAKSIREDLPPELIASMKKSEQALEQLWDPFSSEYFSRDFVTHRLLKVSSIAALLPLYSGVIDAERAEALVRLLENSHRFGPAYPVPSTPLDSPFFDAERYWQGPTWINMNWLIIDGLQRYGFKDHAAALRESTLELVDKGGCHEYFNPTNGNPAGIDNFSWTAALTLDLLKQ